MFSRNHALEYKYQLIRLKGKSRFTLNGEYVQLHQENLIFLHDLLYKIMIK